MLSSSCLVLQFGRCRQEGAIGRCLRNRNCLALQSGRLRQEGAIGSVLEAGLCGAANCLVGRFSQGVLQKVLLDVRLQPTVSRRGDWSVAVPCVGK